MIDKVVEQALQKKKTSGYLINRKKMLNLITTKGNTD